MRSIIITLGILSTVSAFACPNLEGHYSICKSKNIQTPDILDLEVNQAVSNGITTYTFIEDFGRADGLHIPMTYVADGIVHEISGELGSTPSISRTFAECNGKTVTASTYIISNGITIGTASTIIKTGQKMLLIRQPTWTSQPNIYMCE